MKHLFKSKVFKNILFVLIIFLLVKVLWTVVAINWLPTKDINHEEKVGGKSLYYRVKLTPNEAAVPSKKPDRPVQVAGSIKDIKLIAIYNASDTTVVTIEHKRKSKILGRGDSINGFTLEGGGSTYATFSKAGKTYRVDLSKSKRSTATKSSITPSSKASTRRPKREEPSKQVEGDIVDAGDHKIIDKSLITHYSKNIKEIYKNIGIGETKVNGKVQYKITFVKRGSPFAKLGVKRGDVIKSLNGQAINSEAEAFQVIKDIDDIENVTLGILRGKKEMELEYEIN